MALPNYLEDLSKDYATQATAAYKTPLQPSTFMGQQFVAGEDPLQTKAIDAAQAGVGAYEPFLQSAQTNVGAAGTAQAGLGALTGPTAYQPFMSPSFVWLNVCLRLLNNLVMPLSYPRL